MYISHGCTNTLYDIIFFPIYVAIVQLLIDSSRWIGCVPPEVCTLSETIQGDLAHTVLGGVTGTKGHDLPSRYVGSKDKKQRTSSLSGIILDTGYTDIVYLCNA